MVYPNEKVLSTGRRVDGDLRYHPEEDGRISVVYGYDQYEEDVNDDIKMVSPGIDNSYNPITNRERIEIAQWQIKLWQDYVERITLNGEV